MFAVFTHFIPLLTTMFTCLCIMKSCVVLHEATMSSSSYPFYSSFSSTEGWMKPGRRLYVQNAAIKKHTVLSVFEVLCLDMSCDARKTGLRGF